MPKRVKRVEYISVVHDSKATANQIADVNELINKVNAEAQRINELIDTYNQQLLILQRWSKQLNAKLK